MIDRELVDVRIIAEPDKLDIESQIMELKRTYENCYFDFQYRFIETRNQFSVLVEITQPKTYLLPLRDPKSFTFDE